MAGSKNRSATTALDTATSSAMRKMDSLPDVVAEQSVVVNARRRLPVRPTLGCVESVRFLPPLADVTITMRCLSGIERAPTAEPLPTAFGRSCV